MQIREMFTGKRPVVSFEFFPPKTDEGVAALYETARTLQRACNPSFVSVTYGAGGSTRDRTVELVTRIRQGLSLETMAHLTCVGSAKDEIRAVLERLRAGGIENVLALRGDPPAGQTTFTRHEGGFAYASELTRYIKEQGFPFCLGGACYPEGHVETRDLAQDLRNLRHKVDAGVSFLVTQLFFENADYFAFVKRARAAGITLPIVPGLMPITNVAQVERFTKLCGARIPPELHRRLKIVEQDPAAVVAVGVQWATERARRCCRAARRGCTSTR